MLSTTYNIYEELDAVYNYMMDSSNMEEFMAYYIFDM
jgi:hypothetical protein